METKKIPSEWALDSSFALMKDGYNFIRKRCEAHQSDLFKTRMMLKPAICVSGEEAASLIYNNNYFVPRGTTLKRIQKRLFGEKDGQIPDDSLHRQRREMFMSLMGPEQISNLAALTHEQFLLSASQWENEKLLYLLDEARKIMCIVAFQWAGVPFKPEDIPRRSKECGDMFDALSEVGPQHSVGQIAQRSTERWIKNLISQVRGGWLSSVPGSAMYTISFYKEKGKHLNLRIAADELINILKPIVTISNYIVFAAVAMHQHPITQSKIIKGDKNYLDWFVQEVRRFYPFTPFVGARVRDTFTWKGYEFPKGRLVLLDVYGTDHDPRKWERPYEFWPERFRNFKPKPFEIIPQGVDDHNISYRTAGERITLEATKVVVKFLAASIKYDVPDQDLSIDLSHIPAFPKSRFIIKNVNVKKPVY
jgi:fatty-acid peroxygenase